MQTQVSANCGSCFVKFAMHIPKVSYKTKIEIVPGAAFVSTEENHIRMSFGAKPEELEEGMRRLKKWADDNVK